jgi:putative endonuclease
MSGKMMKRPTLEYQSKDWHLYVIRTIDDFLYAGVTTDVARRLGEHLAQGSKAAKYLVAHKPGSLAFSQVIGNRSLALKVEYHFKQLPSQAKMSIIHSGKLSFDSESGKILNKELASSNWKNYEETER